MKYSLHATKDYFHKTKNGRWQLYLKDGILYRFFATPIRSLKQLVVRLKFRQEVLQTGHDSIFACHLGRTKTLARIQSQFFWTGIVRDVRKHVHSCHICQKMSEKSSFPKCQIQPSYISSRPFKKLWTLLASSILLLQGIIDLFSQWLPRVQDGWNTSPFAFQQRKAFLKLFS